VVLVREGGAVLSASVDHSRTGGTATPGTDFSYSGGTSSWSVGDLSTNFFLVPIVHDTLDENNETLQIHLTNPSTGLAIGSPSTVTITIVDDDVAGSVQFASLQTHVSESAKTADITVTRSGGDASGVNVEYATSDGTATAGVDYQETHGTLSFSAGETSKTFSIKLFDDAVVEGDETVDLALIKVGGGGTFGTPSTSTLFILDDDGISNLIFADDFETGDSSRWSQTSP